jgi:hypothetical protein
MAKTRVTPILNYFLNRDVTVENEKATVKGTLFYFKPSIRGEPHEPYVLILKVDDRMVVLRSWDLIKHG